ncbi:DUF6994 family protein [Pseudarthrobacter niigatensis]|uniref:Uncharacterized protein n=1 Tax=Pseudarthrobacter niigatensis TaxID=369935 RepID=A0AAJ1WED9_9MICC|nr:hypothetical protein [Pseudarthrobacter niigatensis]MDQ0144730.1 hypothetical protein [Pseudarthrobacter niigatensis]MDQ0265377.1 hypothetical protein [Pseudarthrobacter niigatensis]
MEHKKAMCVDTNFDVNSDSRGKDPDKYSQTLKDYHQKLWSKDLPCGNGRFDLAPEGNAYLVHRSSNGVFFMASDAITTRLKKRARHIIEKIPPEDLPEWPGYTVGSSIVFPGNKVDGKMTINGARGFSGKIADRFDLTLECIKRYYEGRQEWSPLEKVLGRYDQFFTLFCDFNGYVDFFLLQDLLKTDGNIDYFHDFKDFRTSAVPQDEVQYLKYLAKSNDFISARNARIRAQFCEDPD